MRLEELERELQAERPQIDPDFATRLDEWASRGFPRGGELDPLAQKGRPWFARLAGRRRADDSSKPSRASRALAPVAAAASLVLVVGIVVSQIEPVGDDQALDVPAMEAGEIDDSAGGEVPTFTPDSGRSEDLQGQRELDEALSGPDETAPTPGPPGDRRVARDVSLSLATAPDEFRGAADRVLDVVDDHNGFVMRSSVSGGDPGIDGAEPGRAQFQLRIPTGQLQPALGALSELGHLVSRSDGTRDITARFESARERIETFTGARSRLLSQLEEAATEAEQESIRSRLAIVEERLEDARDDLASALQRVRLVPVSVMIAADGSIRDSSGWGVGDALGDARDILRTALAVGLVSAAVLLPIALIALIAFLLSRAFARHRREQVLDERPG